MLTPDFEREMMFIYDLKVDNECVRQIPPIPMSSFSGVHLVEHGWIVISDFLAFCCCLFCFFQFFPFESQRESKKKTCAANVTSHSWCIIVDWRMNELAHSSQAACWDVMWLDTRSVIGRMQGVCPSYENGKNIEYAERVKEEEVRITNAFCKCVSELAKKKTGQASCDIQNDIRICVWTTQNKWVREREHADVC